MMKNKILRVLAPALASGFFLLLALAHRVQAQESAPTLTLDQAIETALRQNPELAAQEHELKISEARYDGATGRRLPRVDLIGGAYYHLRDQRLTAASRNGEAGAFSDRILSGEVVVSLPLYTGGRLQNEQSAASFLNLAGEHQLIRSRSELIYNVSNIYYNILAQHSVIESLSFSRQALQEHIKKVQEMIAAQKAAAVDRLRIEVRVADLDQRLVAEKNTLAVYRRILANLLGLPAEKSCINPAGELPEVPETPTKPAVSTTELLAARQDFQSAQAAVSARQSTLAAAEASHLPSLSLQGSYGRRLALESPDRAAGLDSNKETAWAGLVMSIPVFSGGQVSALVREERARLSAARERLRKLALQIQLEYETANLNLESARERLEALSKIGEQARESLRIEREKYTLGKGSVTEVLDAQTALLDSQTATCRALADYHTALAQLKLALGE